jgi:hypothetical protein
MRYIKYLGILIILLIAIAGSGCSEKGGGLNLPGGSKTPTPTVTPVPTPAFGNLVITSKPLGAAVFIEGAYRGNAPINLSEMPNGKYNVSLQMELYSNNNFTAEVKGGQTTTISKSLSEARPKIEIQLTDPSMEIAGELCYYSYVGSLKNTGDETLHDAILTIEMKPSKSDYDTVTKSMDVGSIGAGNSRPFGMQFKVFCSGVYRTTIKWEGVEWNDLRITSDDKRMTGSKSI